MKQRAGIGSWFASIGKSTEGMDMCGLRCESSYAGIASMPQDRRTVNQLLSVAHGPPPTGSAASILQGTLSRVNVPTTWICTRPIRHAYTPELLSVPFYLPGISPYTCPCRAKTARNDRFPKNELSFAHLFPPVFRALVVFGKSGKVTIRSISCSSRAAKCSMISRCTKIYPPPTLRRKISPVA